MFSLSDLPYDYSALEPHIDAETMRIHHGKHHAGYVNNLNTFLTPHPELFDLDLVSLLQNLDRVPEDIRAKVKNQAGGVLNHNLFWQFMSPKSSVPEGKLLTVINETFSDLDTFKQQFSTAAAGHFGSGWAWLVYKDGKISITTTPNQDSPCTVGQTPLLCLDIWEHAYYLKFQNRRPDYITAWWNVVNWTEVSSRYLDASTS